MKQNTSNSLYRLNMSYFITLDASRVVTVRVRVFMIILVQRIGFRSLHTVPHVWANDRFIHRDELFKLRAVEHASATLLKRRFPENRDFPQVVVPSSLSTRLAARTINCLTAQHGSRRRTPLKPSAISPGGREVRSLQSKNQRIELRFILFVLCLFTWRHVV